jgi:hypothetical protein
MFDPSSPRPAAVAVEATQAAGIRRNSGRAASPALARSAPAAAAFGSATVLASTAAALSASRDGASTTPAVAEVGFAVGDKVEAQFGGKAKWYGAVVVKAHGNGTYELKYSDGDTETAVPADLVCPAAGPQLAGAFAKGQRVQGRFGGKNKFYSGTVLHDHGDGTFAVKYDDGDLENNVQHVRALRGPESAAAAAGPVVAAFSASAPAAVQPSAAAAAAALSEEASWAGAATEAASLVAGDACEAQFGGKDQFYAGRVVKVNGDGSYQVVCAAFFFSLTRWLRCL